MTKLDEDRASLLAAMYNTPDDDEDTFTSEPGAPPRPVEERPTGIMNMPAMSAAIRQMRTTIEAQDRLIKRMAQRIRNMERQSNKHTQHINQLETELDNKIDRRQS